MKTITFNANNSDETIKLGHRLADSLKAGLGILFYGDLGAGKTTLISGVAHGLGVTGHVKSPTFVLHWQYQGKDFPVNHLDLYRLLDYEELENIGWEEIADDESVYLVEWAQRFDIPGAHRALRVYMEYGDNQDSRRIRIDFDERVYPRLEGDLISYENSVH